MGYNATRDQGAPEITGPRINAYASEKPSAAENIDTPQNYCWLYWLYDDPRGHWQNSLARNEKRRASVLNMETA